MNFIALSVIFACQASGVVSLQVQEPLFGTTINFARMGSPPREMLNDLALTAEDNKVIGYTRKNSTDYYLIQSLSPLDAHTKEEDGGSVVIRNRGQYRLVGSPLTGLPAAYPELPVAVTEDLFKDAINRLIEIAGSKRNFERSILNAGLCHTYPVFVIERLEERKIFTCHKYGNSGNNGL